MRCDELIRRLRRNKDLTQVELAMLVGVSVTAVCEWERGPYAPCPRNAERLSYVLESDELLASLLDGREKATAAARRAAGFNAIVSGLADARDYIRCMSDMSQPMKQTLLSLAFSIVDELTDS